jgi:hypothetical protein
LLRAVVQPVGESLPLLVDRPQHVLEQHPAVVDGACSAA